jgi:hypothetical protein
MGETRGTHERLEMHTFWLENFMGSDHFGDSGVDGRIIFKWNLKKYDVKTTGFK